MRNIRFFIRLLITFISRLRWLFLASFILGVFLFALFRYIAPPLLNKRNERIGIVGRHRLNNLPSQILVFVGEGLTKLDIDNTVMPNLAKSWETPDKGRTWIFTLNHELFWQDGKKIKSSELIYEFSDVEINYPDDKTISFTLKDPFTPFPSILSRPIFKKGLLGTGDWKVDDAIESAGYVQRLVLKDALNNKKVFKFYPTQERAKLAYKLGEVDILLDLFDPSPFDTWETVDLTSAVDSNKIVTIFFNTADSLLSDKSARQALSYAIDKKSLGEHRAISPISSKSWGYNPQVKKYTFNVARAKELLDEVPQKIINNQLKLVTTPSLLEQAEIVAKYWRAVGIDTIVQVTSVTPDDFQAYLTILDAPADPDQYAFWHSTQVTTNISNYSDPRIDNLLEEGRLELSLEKRKKIYFDFQRFLLEDSPAVFLYNPTLHTLTRK